MFSTSFDQRVSFVCLPCSETGPLLPEEIPVAPKHPERALEFAAGRTAARRALEKLGLSPAPAIGRGPVREPIWPEGIRGSISHAGGFAAAAVAKGDQIALLGIDLQDLARGVDRKIARHIATPKEREWLQSAEDLLRLFSAKESIFKAYYPLLQRYIGFQEVEFAAGREQLCGKFLNSPDVPGNLTKVEVSIHEEDGYLLSTLVRGVR